MSGSATATAATVVVDENDSQTPALNSVDIVVVVVYFALVIATSLLSMCRQNRSTVSGFFLAGRHMSWLPVGASLFASNIGSEHFIGLAGSGAAAGIGVGAFEFNAIFLLQLLGWLFLPVFLASRVGTLPEYMSKRFGGNRIRIYLAFLSMFLYIFTKISVNLYSGAIFIQQALRWSLWWSVLGILAVTIVTTVLGGLAAVIYTDTLQFFIMIIGSLIVTVKAFSAVGGYSGLQEKYIEAIPSKTVANTTCGLPATDSWVMLRDPVTSDIPWPGFLLGQTPASIWYWCADQMMVQRALSAKSLSHAQGATLFAGFVKTLPLFIMVLPGMISRVLYTDQVGCVLAEECEKICGNPISCSNIAYPKLVLNLMPQGLRGIMVSVMLAALMSDLTSIFNSASTLFTIDIYSTLGPKSSERRKIFVGRMFVAVMVLISIAWIPLIAKTQGGQLYLYIQSIAAYIAPPIAAVYCLAVCWQGMSEQGAFWSLLVGFAVGGCRMTLDFVYMFDAPRCWHTVDTRPAIIAKVHYMYFAALLFGLTVAVGLTVSRAASGGEAWRLIRTTYATRFDTSLRPDELACSAGDTAAGREQCHEMTARSPAGPASSSGLPSASTGAVSSERADATADSDKRRSITSQNSVSVWRKGYNWLCGFEEHSSTGGDKQSERRPLACRASIDQTARDKHVLNTLLCLVLAIGAAVLVGFSINPFTESDYRAAQSRRLRQLNYSAPWPDTG